MNHSASFQMTPIADRAMNEGELMDFNAIMASIGEAFSELMNLLAGKGFPVEEITAFLGEIVSKIMGMFA